MQKPIFHRYYAADMQSLSVCRDDINNVAKRLQWKPNTTHPLLLCVSELIANTVNYSKSPQATGISLSIRQTTTAIIFEYRDNSGIYNPFQNPVEKLHDISLLAEQGRGLSLIKASCQTVRYREQSKPYVNTIECHIARPYRTFQPHLLLVEDDPAQNLLFSEFLSNDYNVISCHTAAEAINAISQQAVDLVISDISMPDMDGIELRKRLLEQTSTDLIPFMFLTGTEGIEGIENLAHLGIDDFLQKPVSKQRLVATVKRVLGRVQQLTNRFSEQLDQQITAALYPALPTHCLGWRLQSDRRDTGNGGGDALLIDATPNPTIILLDVMGHDISAKFFAHAHTGYLRGLVRSMTPIQDGHAAFNPARLLNAFSSMAFTDNLLTHTILTTLVIELMPNGSLRYASAGHPPPIIASLSGVRALTEGGMLPGILPNNKYGNYEYALQPGERLFIYSDGLFEGTHIPHQRSVLEANIFSAIQESSDMPLEEARDHIMTCFDKSAGNASDDVTLLILDPNLK